LDSVNIGLYLGNLNCQMKYEKDQEDIRLLREGDKKVTRKIYFDFKKSLRSYLRSRYKDYVYYCSDLVQEAFTIVLEMDRTPVLTSELKTFLTGIAVKQLLKKINKDKNLVFNERLLDENAIMESIYEEIESNERRLIINEALRKLKEKCRKILDTFCRTLNCKEAAQRLNYKTEQVFNVKKSECKKELDKVLKDDPRYLEIMKNDEE